eukprot:4490998-Amphidinium_carterae.1
MTSGTDKCTCVSCGYMKIEDAFPRAQLRQEDATSKQKCLACVRRLQWLTCAVCKSEKAASVYSPSMLTYPSDMIACCACQETALAATDMSVRKGWITCRRNDCRELVWTRASATSTTQRVQYCMNCSTRTTRVPDQHTCRSCGDRWVERQTDTTKRQRLCIKCRK